MVRYLVGVDVGTTNIKASLLDAAHGTVVHTAHRSTPVHHPRPEWSEFDPDELWDGVVACLRGCVDAIDAAGAIAAIGVASMGEAGIPVDNQGRPLSRAIAWYDPRATAQCDAWLERVGPDVSFDISGQTVGPLYTVFKLQWLREHQPETFHAMRTWLCIQDFIVCKLCGTRAMDHSIASRTMLFDQRTRGWSPQLLHEAGLSDALFSTVAQAGTRVGSTTWAAAEATGLFPGTPVVLGGHDHLCGAFAVGSVRPGALLDSAGTAEVLTVAVPTYDPVPALLRQGYAVYAHVVPDTYAVVGSLRSSGASVRWYLERHWYPEKTEGLSPLDYEIAFAEAARVAPGSEGLFALPYIRGSGVPHRDSTFRGAFVGISDVHGRSEMLRAILEGLGYWLREALDASNEFLTVPLEPTINVTGGATNSALWMQLKADISGRTVVVPDIGEAVAVGAALLAGVGVGVYPSYEAAASAPVVRSRHYLPDAQRHMFYADRFEHVWRHLFPVLTGLSRS